MRYIHTKEDEILKQVATVMKSKADKDKIRMNSKKESQEEEKVAKSDPK
jgi:hypothetical protein